jgi:hypothetical protein
MMKKNRLLFLICGTLLCTWTAKSDAALRTLYDFEEGAQGWMKIEECAATSSVVVENAYPTSGASALKIIAEFPGQAGAYARLHESWIAYQTLMLDVTIPDTGIKNVKFFVYLKTKEWLWYQSKDFPANPGKTTIALNLSGTSLDWKPGGHKKPWNQYTAEEVNEIGIIFVSQDTREEVFYVDNIRLSPALFSSFRTNGSEIGLYEKFEITFAMPRYFENPFDPKCVAIDAHFFLPSGKEITVPAFFTQDYYFSAPGKDGKDFLAPQGPPEWKVRFSPTEAGVYSYYITVAIDGGKEKMSTNRLSFKAVQSRNPGFVRVSVKDNRYFAFDDGRFFYPIGHNIRSLNDNRYVQMFKMPMPALSGTINFETWLSKMQENGETFFETWMAAWWLALEWKANSDYYEGLGRYNLRNAWKLDWILERAAKRGIYIQLLVINHGAFSTFCDQEWQDNPYNIKNGGFLNSPEEFFTDDRAKQLFKDRLRYIVARWGYSPNILSWEMINEMNLVGASNKFYQTPALANWYREMGDYLAQIDPWQHLITGHYTILYDSDVFKLPQVSYVTTNAYYGGAGNIVKTLQGIANFNARFNKPQFASEFGGNWNAGPKEMLEADIHNGIWAGYHLPLAATPLYWWHNYIEDKDLYFYYRALAKYNEGENRLDEKLYPKNCIISGENIKNLDVLGMGNDHYVLLWFYGTDRLTQPPKPDDAPLAVNASFSLTEMQAGDYDVEFWDTYKGVVLEKKTARCDNGTLAVAIPQSNKDFAVKVKKK